MRRLGNIILEHKAGVKNCVADALSHLRALLSSLRMEVIGFEVVKKLFEEDPNFSHIWQTITQHAYQQYHRQ